MIACLYILNDDVIKQLVSEDNFASNLGLALWALIDIEQIIIDAPLAKDMITDSFSGTAQILSTELASKVNFFLLLG